MHQTRCRRWITLGLVLLQAGAAGAKAVPCGIDLVALRAYFRTGKDTGNFIEVPTDGQQLYAHLEYRVTGAKGPPSASLVALIDGQPLCGPDPHEFELVPFAETACAKPWRATVGTHTLRWELDPSGELAETDETNNVVEVSFTVERTAGVDLVAKRPYLRTGFFQGAEVAHPSVGQDVYLHLDYQVTGTQGSVSADLSAIVDGHVYCSGPFDFQSGAVASVGCHLPWNATAGAHTIQWLIDSSDAVQEANKSNNVAETQFKTSVPAGIDLEAVRAYLRTEPGGEGEEVDDPTCGQSLYFYFDYRLLGTDGPVAATARTLIDGLVTCQGPFTFVNDPSDFGYCTGPWIVAPGRHTVRVEIDFSNDIAETDEGNDAAEMTFNVGGATPCPGDCDGDGVVTVSELIRAVNIALGALPLSDCPSLDTDHDGRVTIGELIAAVNNALSNCPT